VAFTGFDWTRNTWQDSKLYVMDIDGGNPRLVSGEWDRSPQNLQWREDGTGVYFTAQDQGAQNLHSCRWPAPAPTKCRPSRAARTC
jgi:dipeptidyl aminopeptidase/acylaminoacyl peptidase